MRSEHNLPFVFPWDHLHLQSRGVCGCVNKPALGKSRDRKISGIQDLETPVGFPDLKPVFGFRLISK